MIAVLCPTRNRPEQFKRMKKSVEATSDGVLICAASNDPRDTYVRNFFPLDMPTVHMWNVMAKDIYDNTDIKLFMLGADDTVFSTPLWDKALINHYNKLENKIHVYALQDSRDVEGTPHPIVTREFIDAMGYAFMPIFLHWFVDTWTVDIAKANHCFTHLSDFELTHIKPSDHGKADETHTRIRRNGWFERDAYVNDFCKHIKTSEKLRLAYIIQEQGLSRMRVVG